MKSRRIVLIIVFVMTAALGAFAIWIGWRLSQEPEVIPETGEAYTWVDGNFINIYGSATGDWGQHIGTACVEPSTSITGGGYCQAPYVRVYTCECGEEYNDIECRSHEQVFNGGAAIVRYNDVMYDDCTMVQIDAWSENTYDSGSDAFLDYVVWKGNRYCDPTCEPEEELGTCGDSCGEVQCEDPYTCHDGTCCLQCSGGGWSCDPDVGCGCPGVIGGNVMCCEDNGQCEDPNQTYAVSGALVHVHFYGPPGTGGCTTLTPEEADWDQYSGTTGQWTTEGFQICTAQVWLPEGALSSAQLINQSTGETTDIPSEMLTSETLLVGMSPGDSCASNEFYRSGYPDGQRGFGQCPSGYSCTLPCGGANPCCSRDSWWDNGCIDPATHSDQRSEWKWYGGCWVDADPGDTARDMQNFDFIFTQCSSAPTENLTCDSLTWDRDLSRITEDELRTDDVTVGLTTTVDNDNYNVSNTTGYTYGTDVPSATFSNGTANGPNNSFVIPQGTTNGTYNVWVQVTGTSNLSGSQLQSGCTSATSCQGGGEGCLLSFTVGEGTCDCESVTRSPSTGDPLPGSSISFTMNAQDQNGVPCNVDPDDVTWSTTGTPTLVQQSRVPTTDPLPTHNITYQVPGSAGAGTNYTVSAIVDGNSQVPACAQSFTTGNDENPAYVALKTAQVQCINNNTAALITYSINIENISNVDGVIEYVEDTYDARYQNSWVSNIIPTPDSHSGNVIRWDNNDSGFPLSAGGSLTFTYQVTLPSDYFGTIENGVYVPNEFRNNVSVKPQNHDAIELSAVVTASCLGATGLFDNVIIATIAAVLFILIGFIGFRNQPQLSLLLTKVENLPPVSNTLSLLTKVYDEIKFKFSVARKPKKERFEEELMRKTNKNKE